MANFELADDERAAVVAALRKLLDEDKFPFSPIEATQVGIGEARSTEAEGAAQAANSGCIGSCYPAPQEPWATRVRHPKELPDPSFIAG